MELYAAKNFPDNYPQDVLRVLEALSMTGLKGVKLVGSASIRSQLYAGDYDATDTVKASSVKEIATALKDVVKSVRTVPDCYFGDIKCGEVPEWDCFSKKAHVENGKIVDFNITQSKSVISSLLAQKIISPSEATEYNSLLDDATTPLGFLEAKKSIRVHILRWLPSEILSGSLTYRGHKFTLEDAILSRGMIKTDAIANISDRFTEFSMIYDVILNGSKLLVLPIPVSQSLMEDIIYYDKKNPFKALKRVYALAKLKRETEGTEYIVKVLNSDLGRLYQIINDLKTLQDLLSRPQHPMKEIRSQIDAMKARMGNIYQLKDFLSHEHDILGSLNSLLKSPMKTIEAKLEKIILELEVILAHDTEKHLKELRNNIKS